MFSGIVKIADIDDYINPSQNCIKPLIDKALNVENKQDRISTSKIEQENQSPSINETSQKNTKKRITIEDNVNSTEEFMDFYSMTSSKPDLIKIKDKSTKSAKVSLNDCLACNGCVTTAETILIQAQSVDEFLKNTLNFQISHDKTPVVCISPQSILSLAEYYQLTPEKIFSKFCNFMSKIGVKYVFNFNTALMLSVTASYEEFKRRILLEKENFLICSECPGWICYAEKKVGDWVIPYTSKIKSPQQIMGHLIKKIFKEKLKISSDVYLTCVMPCYDKKLEATRETYKYNQDPEVDCVISTIELPELFTKMNFNFSEESETNLNNETNFLNFSKLLDNKEHISKFYAESSDTNLLFASTENFSSNGYAEFILNEYVKEFLITKNKKYNIERKLGKNSDYKEIFLFHENETTPILSLCIVYGFRNIQNILRLKNKIKYNYIEIMACPGGCINGGGQMRPNNQSETARDVLKRIEENVKKSLNQDNEKINSIGEDIQNLLKEFTEQEKREIFEANFKALDKQSQLNLKW